jgi:isoquinoline 1-oxidoreductase beta subunit
MSPIQELTRRDFVKVSSAAGAGLVLSLYLPGCGRDSGDGEPFAPNAWIRIAPDGAVTVVVDRSEMGQGVTTGLPMLIAEELEVDLERVGFEFAPAGPAYANPAFGMQITGGSTSTRSAWEPLRKAGAAARTMLVAAAAARWGVPASECRAEAGTVLHEGSGRSADYGDLVAAAAEQPVPDEVAIKDPADLRLLGKPRPRMDTPPKVDGTAIFGIDVKVEGMRIATVARCPVFGGKVSGYDDAKARAVPGVRDVVRLDDERIAVVADHYWAALQGKRALDIEWDTGSNAGQTSERISSLFRELAAGPGAVARDDGDVEAGLRRARRRLRAAYELPFLAHATMEPMNCTADVRPDGCEVWAPTQNQTGSRGLASDLTGLPLESVTVHTTYLGGGFGRRAEIDFVADAVATSKAVGAPVKVVWSREDDVRHDFYRPASYHVLEAGLDGQGRPTAWTHRLVVPSIMLRWFPDMVQDGLDGEAVEGAAMLPYAIPNVRVDYHHAETGIPVGFWRSVNHTHNGYVIECFLDELARAAGSDPFEYRRGLLSEAPRHLRVLERAAEAGGWGRRLPEGQARGIAVHESFGSFVAEVAEVSIADGRPRVHRVVCAVDCGPTVNPNIIEAQMQSGIVYGLTAALYGRIGIRDGRVEQGNFDDYRMLRIDEMPEVEVHIVESSDSLGGIGEVATPPIAPAVVNALHRLTGRPIRSLPIEV